MIYFIAIIILLIYACIFRSIYERSVIDTTKINCDYHKYLKTGIPPFRGEYMSQYSWAEKTLGLLMMKTEI